MAHDGEVTIRSFHIAFEFERRLFKVDRWRLPVAYGLPLRGIGYAALALAAVVAAGRIPVLGALVEMIPAPVRFVLVPCAAAYALSRVEVDGRRAHTVGAAWLRHCFGARRVAGWRRADETLVVIGEITFSPDEHCSRYRRAVVAGPARLRLRYPVRAHARRHVLTVEQASPQAMRSAKEVLVRRGGRVWLR